MEFTVDILKKYSMLTLDEYKKRYGDDVDTELTFYQTFLLQTDHIPNKIIEAQFLGEATDNYVEVLQFRKLARQRINEITER